MARLIEAQTRFRGWLEATDALLATGPELNLILSITKPGFDGPDGKTASAVVDDFLHEEGQQPLHTVAETIFPGWSYRKHGFEKMSEMYVNEEYPLIKKSKKNSWGTYAYRLLRRTDADGKVTNPLANLINKMKTEISVPRSKHACYEIGVAEGEYDLPLYNTTDDDSRHMGGPCLSHVSFKYFGGAVHLTAVYRSHDYRFKTLGNLLGLARLQACVAKEVGVPLGSLVVHSTYAWLQQGRGSKALMALVAQLREATHAEAVSA